MIWKVAKAKQHLSELLHAAAVNGTTFEDLEAWREAKEQGSIGSSFAEVRRLCRDEAHDLVEVARQDRATPWAQALEDLEDEAEAPQPTP